MDKGKTVIYIDARGVEHEALVRALNPLNAGYITVAYVDESAPEPDNLKTVYDIAHHSGEAKNESNPELPRYVLNCWKEAHEEHVAIPEDHPSFDHPFATQEQKDAQKAKLKLVDALDVVDAVDGVDAPPSAEAIKQAVYIEVKALLDTINQFPEGAEVCISLEALQKIEEHASGISFAIVAGGDELASCEINKRKIFVDTALNGLEIRAKEPDVSKEQTQQKEPDVATQLQNAPPAPDEPAPPAPPANQA